MLNKTFAKWGYLKDLFGFTKPKIHIKKTNYLHYLKGKGLEIGALNNPMVVPNATEIIYSDYLTPEEIDEHFPGAKYPDIISNSESFPEISDNYFDFIIANHVLEHLTDPIGGLTEWHRILRHQGILFLTIPDKRFTFDATRDITTLDHLIKDHQSKQPAKYLNFEHLKEWATHVEKLQESSQEWREWIDAEFNRGYSVHNHVWLIENIFEMVNLLRDAFGTKYTLKAYNDTPPGDIEFIIILEAEKIIP